MKYAFAYIISKLLDGLFFQKRLPGIPVLMYHAIGGEDSKLFVSKESFEQQARFLTDRRFRSILPYELASVVPGEKVFLITFDDGFKSVRDIAFPILERYGFKATVFLATDYVGKKSAYAKSGPDKLFDLMSADDIRELAESGWCIANHCAGHKNLAETPSDEVLREYHRAGEALGRMATGASKQVVAYPFNRYNQEVMRALREAGASMAFNGHNRLYTKSDNRMAIPRVEVNNNFVRFKLIFSPSFNRIKQYVR